MKPTILFRTENFSKKKRISEMIAVDKSDPNNIETGVSNLFLKGAKYDTNGNQVIIVGFPNDRGFSIQTNGNLPQTHDILYRNGGRRAKLSNLSDTDIQVIGREVTDYVREFGSRNAKGRLKTYSMGESKLSEAVKFDEKKYRELYQRGKSTDGGASYGDFEKFLTDKFGGRIDAYTSQAMSVAKNEDDFVRIMRGFTRGEMLKFPHADKDSVTMRQPTSKDEGVVTESKTSDIKTVLDNYLIAALWSSNDESDESGGEPLDSNYTIDDVSAESLLKAKRDVERFIDAVKKANLYQKYMSAYGDRNKALEMMGHDFWLTRNGHGAGFWDRTELDNGLGDKLTKISDTFKESYMYVGDDGLIHIQ